MVWCAVVWTLFLDWRSANGGVLMTVRMGWDGMGSQVLSLDIEAWRAILNTRDLWCVDNLSHEIPCFHQRAWNLSLLFIPVNGTLYRLMSVWPIDIVSIVSWLFEFIYLFVCLFVLKVKFIGIGVLHDSASSDWWFNRFIFVLHVQRSSTGTRQLAKNVNRGRYSDTLTMD